MAGVTRRPTLSLILINYNDGDLLESAIRNRLAQTRPPDEFIVVDDGSNDQSREILTRLTVEFPHIKGFLHSANVGTVRALKTGIEQATGDYVYLTGSDDYMHPDLLRRSIEALEAHPEAGLSLTDFHLATGAGSLIPFHHGLGRTARYIPPDEVASLLNGVHLHGVGMVMRRDLLAPHGYFDPGLGHHHDWFASLVTAFRTGICYIPESLAYIAVRDKSWSQAGKNRWEVMRGIIGRAFDLLADPQFADVVPYFIQGRAFQHFEGGASLLLHQQENYVTEQTIALAGMTSDADVSVIIPSRGRPKNLVACVRSCLMDPAAKVEVLVCLDDDDETRHEAIKALGTDSRVFISINPRPKTIGAIVNAAAAQARGKWLFFLADDYTIPEADWCARLLAAGAGLPRRIGVLHPHDQTLPGFCGQPIISRETRSITGYFMSDIFPFWFADTWWDEVGHMLGAIHQASFSVVQQDGKGKTHNMRDLAFWVEVFEKTRIMREMDARKLAVASSEECSREAEWFLIELPEKIRLCAERTSHLSHPSFIAEWEAMAGDSPSLHYAAVKASAEALLARLDNFVSVTQIVGHETNSVTKTAPTSEHLRQMQGQKTSGWPSLVPEMSSGLHEGVAQTAPDDGGSATEGHSPQLRQRLQESGQIGAEAVRDVREEKNPDAPPGLHKAPDGDLALRPVSPKNTPRPPKQLVIFSTPSLSGSVTMDYLKSWTNTAWMLKDLAIPHGRSDRSGDCFVDKVRCKLVQDFLDGDGTDLFFLDDDLGWPAAKVVEFIRRPEPILAGVYPKKMDNLDFPVALEANVDTGELITDQGLYLAQFCGGGFLRIKREVLEKLAPLVERFKDIEMDGGFKDYPLLFDSGRDSDGWWCGEDVSFFRLARANGYPVWIDPAIEFKHKGNKVWKGNLSEHLDSFRKKAKIAVARNKEPA